MPRKGSDLLTPGASPTFSGVRSKDPWKKLDFLSLMLALFAGTASLPHILIRYYTVKDAAAARKSTFMGIAAIGFFYILTLYLGLGAMTSGSLDPTDSNMAAPLLAKSFNEPLFAIISAIAFTTVLGTVSGLMMAGAGAVAHDLMETLFKVEDGRSGEGPAREDRRRRRLGIGAMVLGILFKSLNVSFLVGWAFNIAASEPARADHAAVLEADDRKGISAAIAGRHALQPRPGSCSQRSVSRMCTAWTPGVSPVPFSQPALVTIPLGFVVLIVVSLLTSKRRQYRDSYSNVTWHAV